jgi:formylglycine-generating enzyme required for sulfatase activity
MFVTSVSFGVFSTTSKICRQSEPLATLRRRGEFPGEKAIDRRDGSVFVWVPAGNFLFGANKEPRSLPGFWIGQECVSRDRFEKFCKRTGYVREKYRLNKDLRTRFIPYKGGPMVENQVDYYDALA